MQSLMVDFIISLDGYGAADGWPGFWGMEGPEYLGWLEEQEEHTALMGAATYRLMCGERGALSPQCRHPPIAPLPAVSGGRGLVRRRAHPLRIGDHGRNRSTDFRHESRSQCIPPPIVSRQSLNGHR